MKKNKSKTGIVLLLFLLLILGGAFGGFTYYKSALKPVSDRSEEVVFTIDKGSSAKSVLNKLKNQNIIKDVNIAYLYLKQNNLTDIKAGDYQIDKSWTLDELFGLFTSKNGAINTDIKVTIPEGEWASDVARIIAEKMNVSSKRLLELWNDADYLKTLIEKYDVLTDDVLNEKLNIKLEGYLFPETYYFKEGASEEDITERLLSQTQKVYDKYSDEIKKSDLSVHEIFTLASITQFESGDPNEDPTISGIWFNRLNSGMALQSSVTVCYVIQEKGNACELYRNQDKPSPYNTYLNPGIPVGPVCNPGEDAIASVLNPVDSDYFYFIADRQGNIHYARTYAEHNANINQYLK